MEGQLHSEINAHQALGADPRAMHSQNGHNTDRSVQLIEFRIKNEYYLIPIEYVREVVLKPAITRLPQSQSYIQGIANIRGQVISVIDLSKRLGVLQTTDPDNHKYILVLEVDSVNVGVLVCEVPKSVTVKTSDINIADDTMSAHISIGGVSYLEGIVKQEDRMSFLIDVKTLIKS